MASYGFGPNSKGWNESKKGILAKVLKELVEDIEDEGKFIGLTRGQRPYVLVDEPSRGITIMNIDYMPKEFQHDTIRRANWRYLDVMAGTHEKDSGGFVLSNNI
jgi:hypothetical protein